MAGFGLSPVPPAASPPSVRDEVLKPDLPPADFAFNSVVAGAFDDRVGRSVPFYAEMQRMVCERAADFAEPGTSLYDPGCSTATTLLQLDPLLKPGLTYIGADNSPDMLAKARQKPAAAQMRRECQLICSDLHEGPAIGNLLIYTGVFAVHGNPVSLAAGIARFVSAYVAIVAAEETYLRGRFGEGYGRYCADVSRWLPDFSRLAESTAGMLRKDYSSCGAWMLAICALMAYKAVLAQGRLAVQPDLIGWGAAFAAVLLIVIARGLKKAGRLNPRPVSAPV